jgi:hydrogenase expression/formation protein HypD
MNFMEVCGGHTAAIYRFGLTDLLPESVRLLSGPGCPVCVTANSFIDRAVALAQLPNTALATFGDLFRVPGSTRSLADVHARGCQVNIFYSAMDALNWAVEHPGKTVIFLGIGFETTACTLASTLRYCRERNIGNFRFLSAVKTMPRVLHALLSSPDIHVDGLILPGHVSTVTGYRIFDFIPGELHIPCVVSGFEPFDLMESVFMLCRQVSEGRCEVENQYRRVVKPEGNQKAQEVIAGVFTPCDMEWRGFGVVPGSGLKLQSEYHSLDADAIEVEVEIPHEHPACRCGDVLRGAIHPAECPLFGSVCTPEEPFGACMVSSEGACAAVYHYIAA